jgi:hypothetical protein
VALHYVDAFLATAGLHPQNHDQRTRLVATVSNLKPIYSDYRTLQERSREARYELRQFSEAEAISLIEKELGRIKAHIVLRLPL